MGKLLSNISETRNFRFYPTRPLAASGAVIIDKNKVLLVKRRFDPGSQRWSIPGGLVELGESVKEAAKREVEEEVGLKIKIIKLIDVIDNITRDRKKGVKFHYVLTDYLAKPISGKLKGNREILDLGWFSKSEISNLVLTRTSKHLLKKIGFIDKREKTSNRTSKE